MVKRSASLWDRMTGGINMKHLALFKVIGGLIILAAATSVAAQDTAAVLEEIIVTAQKREQSLADLGMTVDVVSGERLRDVVLVS